jgi:hypothetical protein
VGEHVIDPGRHIFRIDKEGKISSTDPDITVEGRTVTLKTYRIEIMSVDADKSGPPETRLMGRQMNVDEILPGFSMSSNRFDEAHVKTTLRLHRDFRPLRVYLPANTNEQAYILRPGMQLFHVRPGGTVEFKGTPAPGLKAEGSQILLP